MLPVITISRQYGSGGHEVGEKVAQKLNLPFYDKALIAMAAKKSGLCEKIFENFDERPKSLLYSIAMDSYMFALPGTGVGDSLEQQVYLATFNTIRHLAEQGPCVIIGRCADYILREHENCLNVFVHADKAARIKRIVGLGHCEEKKAPDFVTKKDKQRANYYNFYSNNRWDDLLNYDLTIDTSRFSVDMAVDLIIDAAKKLDV